MDVLAKERDRVLQRAARVYGLGFTAVSAICLVLPDALPHRAAVLGTLALYVALAALQFVAGRSRNPFWVLLILLTGVGILSVVTELGQVPLGAGTMTAIQLLMSGSLASVAIVLTGTAWRFVSLGVPLRRSPP